MRLAGTPALSFMRRNILWNLAGQIIPVLVGLLAIPLALRGLGLERFGLLSLLWTLQGATGLLDVGLGRATTKFTAELRSTGRVSALSGLLHTAVALSLAFGAAIALLLAAAAGPIAQRLLRVQSDLQSEFLTALVLIAAATPIVIVEGTLRGVLEGLQQFPTVNLLRMVSRSLLLAVAAAACFRPLTLVSISVLTTLVYVGTASAYVFKCQELGILRLSEHRGTKHLAKELLAFGGWVGVSNVVGPILFTVDRVLVGAILSPGALAYYIIPQQLVMRLFVAPASVMPVLFPIFSTLEGHHGTASGEAAGRLYARTVVWLAGLLTIVTVPLAALARPVLAIWLGEHFARESALVLKILAIGTVANCCARVPYDYLQAVGRVALTAKLHLVELPLFVAAAARLTWAHGIVGTAVAWTMRLLVEAAFLFWAVSSRCESLPKDCPPRALTTWLIRCWVILSVPVVTGLVPLRWGLLADAGAGLLLATFLIYLTARPLRDRTARSLAHGVAQG